MKRIQTKEQRAALRASMIPAGAEPDPRNGPEGEAYTYERGGRFYAVAFNGSAGRAAFHFWFRTPEAAAQRVYEFFQGIKATREYKNKLKVSKAAPHDVKVGDIFSASWGYDQTNIDYYEIVSLIGSTMAEVQQIQAESETTEWMQGKSVPCPGKPRMVPDNSEAGRKHKEERGFYPQVPAPTFRVKLQGGKSPAFRVDHHYATRMTPIAMVGDKPVFRADHWTAYA